jgi:outer membrane protein, heavy metal efflux system
LHRLHPLSIAARLVLIVACLLAWLFSAVARAEAPSLPLGTLPGEEELARLLWERSPEFAVARARLASARADLVRAGLLPNPELELNWGTIPLGPTNPPGLRRLAEVPNYTLGLSQLMELGKRGPRQDSARAALAATALDIQATLRERTYELLLRAAEVATTQVRLGELQELVGDAARLTELQRLRQQHGESTGLDVDRTSLEEIQLQGQLSAERTRLAEALLACSQVSGLSCQPFGAAEAASAFLAARLGRPPAPNALQERPDLRALEAQRQSAQAALTLAHRQWLPDPTLRAGYVHDRFVISGNQLDSFFVGLSMPLPVFNHGQAEALAASSLAESSAQARTQLLAQAERSASSLATQLEQVEARRARLRTQVLPLAEGLVQRLEAAVRAGGASLQELLLTRRSYGQLLLEAADLDLSAFRLAVELDRTRAAGPRPPEELSARF